MIHTLSTFDSNCDSLPESTPYMAKECWFEQPRTLFGITLIVLIHVIRLFLRGIIRYPLCSCLSKNWLNLSDVSSLPSVSSLSASSLLSCRNRSLSLIDFAISLKLFETSALMTLLHDESIKKL